MKQILKEFSIGAAFGGSFALLTSLVLAIPASATPQSPDYTNGGQCAGDRYSKCRYSLEIVKPAVDNGLMTNVPNFGQSRVETVSFCLRDAGVTNYQQLTTDMQWETFEGCMTEHT